MEKQRLILSNKGIDQWLRGNREDAVLNIQGIKTADNTNMKIGRRFHELDAQEVEKTGRVNAVFKKYDIGTVASEVFGKIDLAENTSLVGYMNTSGDDTIIAL